MAAKRTGAKSAKKTTAKKTTTKRARKTTTKRASAGGGAIAAGTSDVSRDLNAEQTATREGNDLNADQDDTHLRQQGDGARSYARGQ